MSEPERHGARLETAGGAVSAVRAFLAEALKNSAADAVLVPVATPAQDSYAWILTTDPEVVRGARPIAPTMPVQGAKALKSLTRKGNGKSRVIAVMRPCEIRAAIELAKLNQVHLDNIVLVSHDCHGSVPLQTYVGDPAGSEKDFDEMLEAGKSDEATVKPVCRICVDFSLVDSDLHLGTIGLGGKSALLIAGSDKGQALLDAMGMTSEEDVSAWSQAIAKLKVAREGKRSEALAGTGEGLQGFDGLHATFSDCIGCHNCQSACPICYCRQCYFDSEVAKKDPAALLDTAVARGGIAFPGDRVMFHTGRMAHMSLSCVSCGQCTDACPVGIPVADVFSYMAGLTQDTFEYAAGARDGEPLPLRQYREQELAKVHEIVKGAEEGEASDE
jgi:formate dehydrogenase subunit beta